MAPSFFRKLVSRAKAKRSKVIHLRTMWIRPSVEALDVRILPSVTANLKNGILAIAADTTGGTTQVEIVHAKDQVMVEDGGQVIDQGTYTIDQIQQIQFQYTTQDQQQYNLNLPVGKNQISLTGLPVGEADLNLGDSSLTAGINATLPDGTALSIAGSITNDGQYDLTGKADITVDNFPLQGASFEVTNSSVAVGAALTIGSDNITLAGSLDDQGSFDLKGTSDNITVGGFALTNVSAELTNDNLAVDATLTLGSDSVTLDGSYGSDGSYDLQGTADITIAGFALPSTSFDLKSAPGNGISVSTSLPLFDTTLGLSGTVDAQGDYDLTATADNITVGGFALANVSAELTNDSLTLGTTVTLGSDSITLNGTVGSDGSYDLTGTADITIAGFSLTGVSFELTSGPADGIHVATSLPLLDTTLSLSGTVDVQGDYDLTATADNITVGGFALTNVSAELTNDSLTLGTTVTLGSDSITLNGTVGSDGSYDLTGTADITIAGFSLTGVSFELTSGPADGIHVATSLPVFDATVDLSGTVDAQGNYDLTGSSDNITVGGFALTGVSVELTNDSLTVAATLGIGSDSIDLSGTVGSDGSYDLMGTANITVATIPLSANFELTNNSGSDTLTVSSSVSILGTTVNLSGTVDSQGNYDLTGTADITVASIPLHANFELTNTTLTVSAGLDLGSIGSVTLMGTYANGQLGNLTGTAAITVDGFNLNATFTLSNTSLTVAADLSLGSIATVHLTGTVMKNGSNYSLSDLTGMAQIMVDGFNLNATFDLGVSSLTVAADLGLGSIATVHVTGTVNKNGSNYSLSDLTGTAAITVDGFNLNGNFKLTSTQLVVTTTLALGTIASVNLMGTVNKNGSNYSLSDLTGTAQITVDGINLNATFDLGTSSLTVAADLSLGSIATVHLTGTVTKNGSNYSLSDLTGTAQITVDGFNLNANFKLTSTQITVSTTLALGSVATVNLSGTVNKNGSNYSLSDLTGTAAITVAGFNLTGNFKLTSTQITVSTHIDLGSVASVDLSGTVNKNGSNYSLSDLTGSAAITVAGFNLTGNFKLTSTQITVTTHIDLGSVAKVDLSGTVNKNGSNYSLSDLTGTAAITVAGFNLTGNFKLTSTQITVSTHIDLGSVASVDLSGTVNKNGSNYSLSDLTGTAAITVAGFNLTGNFKLTSTQITVTTHIDLGSVAKVDLSGTVNKNGSNYSLSDLTGTAAITVGSFSLTGNFKLTSTQITVSTHLDLGSVASVDLSGTVNKNGSNYSLSDLTGQAQIHVGSFTLTGNFKLTPTQITVSTHIDLGSVASVDLSGTVNKNGSNYTLGDLTGQAQIHVGSFTLTGNFKLTPTQITVSTHLDLGSVASVDLSGTVNKNGSNYSLSDLTGSATIHVGSFTLTGNFKLTPTQITVSTHVDLGSVASVDLSGTVNKVGSNYTLGDLTGTAAVHFAGLTLNANFKLTTTQITATAGITIPNFGTVSLTGVVNKNGSNFSLDSMSGAVDATIVGFPVHATFTLTAAALTLSTSLDLPVVGHVNLSGTVDRNTGAFSITAGVSNIHILFFDLTSASVTVSNSSIMVAAHATNLPLIGSVDFKGTFQGSNITFTVTLPDVAVLGFHIKNVMVTLTSSSLSVSANATGLPIVGDVNFSGTIQSGGFTLSASKSNVTLLGFIHFNTVALTLNSSALTLSAATTLPIVGNVTFAGSILFSGSFEISATANHFTLLGFIGFDNAKVALSFPNIKLTVSAHISLLNIGYVDFTGTIGAGGSYSFTGTAGLKVAGFDLGHASMHLGSDPTPGDPPNTVHIGPFTTPPLPLVGAVTIGGYYGSGGVFGFRTTIHPNPPIFIGPIPVDTITFGLSNDSLTLGIGVGYNLAGILDLTGYGEVTVYAQSAQHNWGDFRLLASVNVSILGFSAANAQMVLANTKGQFSFTLDMNLNLLIANANMHGEIDFNKGLVFFAGRATIGVAHITLSNSTFIVTNAQFTGDAVNGYTVKHDAQGHLISGGGIHIEVHSHTNLNLPPVINANVDFDGVFAKQGSSYYIDVKGKANLTIAGFTIASATLDIDNTHIAVTFHYAYPGIFSIDFAGLISWANGKWDFDFRGNGSIGLASFPLASGSVHIYYLSSQGNKAGLDIAAHVNVFVAQVDFSGYLHSNGQFQLTGSANVGLAGFNVARASFTLNNSGVTFSTTINVIVATVNFSGYVRSNGQFQLTGSANVGLAGFNVASASFTLNNGGVTFSTQINVIVARVNFSGYVHSNGQYQLTGSASVGLAGFPVASASFTLNNSGVTFSTRINVFVAQVNFSGYVRSNGQFQLTGSATISLLGFSAATASFTLNNSGVTFSARINVIVATVNFSGYVRSNGQFQLTGSATVGFVGFGGNGSFTLNNSGVTVHASISLPAIGGITMDGYVRSNGQFGLTFSGNFGIRGYGVHGTVSFDNNHIGVSASLNLWVINMSVNGNIGFNGTFRFTAHVGINIIVAGASVDVNFSNTGFGVTVNAHLGLGATVGSGFWTVGVGANADAHVGFNINTNGTFSAGGSINFQACALACFSVGIGFSMDNHTFRVLTHNIGFSVFGLSFHPFGDLVFHY